MKLAKNQSYRGQVSGLNSQGEGVVKIDGYAFFVKGALPGEDVTFRAVKLKKSYGYGKLEEIHHEAEDRVDLGQDAWLKQTIMPLSHMTYDKQLAFKRDQVLQAFTRIGGFDKVQVQPTVGMDHPYHYRNKAQVPVQEINGQLKTGIFRPRSHELIPTVNTYITDPVIDELVAHIRDILNKYGIKGYDEENHQGNIRHIVVRRGHHTGQIMIILVTKDQTIDQVGKIIEEIIAFGENIVSLVQNIQPKKINVIMGKDTRVLWGQDYYMDQMLGLDFKISARSFFQVNTSQAEKLYELALDQAGLGTDDIVLDAYCGIGTISLCLAQRVKRVYGIEIVEDAVEMARDNAQINGQKNAIFEAGKAEDYISYLHDQGISLDAVVVDPPRKGLDQDFIKILIDMEVPKLIYISCNPSTQARDCKVLAQAGYHLDYLRPVDMFPQTPHVEAIAVLSKDR